MPTNPTGQFKVSDHSMPPPPWQDDKKDSIGNRGSAKPEQAEGFSGPVKSLATLVSELRKLITRDQNGRGGANTDFLGGGC